MKNIRIRRIFAVLLSLALLIPIGACTRTDQPNQENTTQSGTQDNSGKLFPEPVTIKLAVGSHPSWPYDENWIMWDLFREKTGADLQVQAIPTSDMTTKVNLMMANPSEMPDMIFLIGDKATVNTHAAAGALVAISDYQDQMPNYTKFWNSLPEAEKNENMLLRVSGDGKIYFPPNYGIQTVGNTRAWLYRKDIFDKHGLETPETLDDMYDVAKKLKELYPDSYPVCMRSGLANLDLVGAQWQPQFTVNPYYDYDTDTWRYGVTEPVMKDIVEYFRRLVEEGLIPPDFLTIPAKSWEELVSTNRGFMMPEYLLRIDFFTEPAREMYPDFTLAVMEPPRANTPTGQNKIAKLDYELTGYVVCNTGDETRINNAIKLLDWMYSDEGCEFQSWGEEGKTYEMVNGEHKWLVEEGESPYAKLGIGTPGLYQRVYTEANEALYSKEQGIQGEIARPYQEERISPFPIMDFSSDLVDERTQLYMEIDTYVDEQLSKFIQGQQPMSEWDHFQNELKEMGTDRLLELYTEMYKRLQESGIFQ